MHCVFATTDVIDCSVCDVLARFDVVHSALLNCGALGGCLADIHVEYVHVHVHVHVHVCVLDSINVTVPLMMMQKVNSERLRFTVWQP